MSRLFRSIAPTALLVSRVHELPCFALAVLLLLSPATPAADVLIRHAQVYDGTGGPPRAADVRVRGRRIIAVAPSLAPEQGEEVREARGLAVAPGFIDVHSHAEIDLFDDLDVGTVTRQGITTVLVGQDGQSEYPLADWLTQIERTPPAVNVASLVGHVTIRERVLGQDLYRAATPAEVERMKPLLAQELASGAFGLSSGLEYENAHFATTEEMVELARVAGAAGGFYQSHIRDEANAVYDSFDEVLRIGREARLPVQITHIKLGSTPVWHTAAARMPEYFERARREGIELWADVYPYTFWYSTIRVILPDRDWFNVAKVERALADNGGPAAFRLGRYKPQPDLAGRTLEDAARTWGVSPVEAYMRIVRTTATQNPDGSDFDESVMVTSMHEDDVRWFVAAPGIMFCSDGMLHDEHPRAAGAFPRVLGRYVREQRLLTLEAAIHKMTGLPARRLGLDDRGRIEAGYVADLVLFDPATVIDRATVDAPQAPPSGIPHVMIAGEWVVRDGVVTGAHPGRALRRSAN